MGSVRDCYHNAMCESFFAARECDLIDRMVFQTRHTARLGVFDFIESLHNPRRRHSSIRYVSPVIFETRWARTEQSQ